MNKNEKILLSWMVLNGSEGVRKILPEFRADYLEMPSSRKAYAELEGYIKDSRPIPAPELCDKIQREYAIEGFPDMSAISYPDHYIFELCESIKVDAFKRDIQQLPDKMKNMTPEESREIYTDLYGKYLMQTTKTVLDEHITKAWQEITLAKTGRLDFRTEIAEWDKATGGLRKGNLYVWAGYTSHGKSAMAVNITSTLLRQGAKVAFFSLEMSESDIIKRLISIDTDVPYGQIWRGELHAQYEDRVKVSIEHYRRLRDKLFIFSKGITVDNLFSIVRRYRPQIIFIDYIQLLADVSKAGYKESTTKTLDKLCARLKNYAIDENVVICILGQINRMAAAEKRTPSLGDLRDSGGIEQSADVVSFCFWPWRFDNTKCHTDYQLIIAKNRQGETKDISLRFDSSCMKFSSNLIQSDIVPF